MTTQLPSYANALTVPTLTAEEADLLSRFPGAPSAAAISAALLAGQPVPTGTSSILAGWSQDAPQANLVTAEAQALQFMMVQRAALAFAASPQQVLQLQAFLASNGYSATAASVIASAYVDVVLAWYQTPRLAATYAVWSIPLSVTTPQVVDQTSAIVVQATDGTFFLSNQVSAPVAFQANSTLSVQFIARQPGTSGNVIPNTIAYVNQAPVGMAIKTQSPGGAPTGQFIVTPARDTESDDSALARAIGRWGTLSGILTKAGWQYVMQTPSVGGVATLVTVFVDDTNPLGAGSVEIAVADATGSTTPAELAQAKAQGVKYTIAGMGTVGVVQAASLSVAITATIKTNGNNPLAATQATSALVQLGPKAFPVLVYDVIIQTIMNIAGVTDIATLSVVIGGVAIAGNYTLPPSTVAIVTPNVTAI